MLMIGLEFDSRIDKELLAMKIAQVCGPMTPVHNTSTSYVTFHELFFKMWSPQIKRLLDTLDIKYNPLDNYRREEDLKLESAEKTGVKSNSTTTHESDSSSADESKTSAYNEDLYQPNSINEFNNHEKGNDKTVRDDTRDKNIDTKENNVIKGLNGLFTSQQLLQQEREVAQYNVYQWIVNKYMEELFICVF